MNIVLSILAGMLLLPGIILFGMGLKGDDTGAFVYAAIFLLLGAFVSLLAYVVA